MPPLLIFLLPSLPAAANSIFLILWCFRDAVCSWSRPLGPDGIGPVQPSRFHSTGKRPDLKSGQEPRPGPGPGPANGTAAAAASAASTSRTPIRGESPAALSQSVKAEVSSSF